MELIESERVKNDHDFVIWKDLTNNNLSVDVYIEKRIINELEKKSIIEIHATIGEVKGETVGLLFIKKNNT